MIPQYAFYFNNPLQPPRTTAPPPLALPKPTPPFQREYARTHARVRAIPPPPPPSSARVRARVRRVRRICAGVPAPVLITFSRITKSINSKSKFYKVSRTRGSLLKGLPVSLGLGAQFSVSRSARVRAALRLFGGAPRRRPPTLGVRAPSFPLPLVAACGGRGLPPSLNPPAVSVVSLRSCPRRLSLSASFGAPL